MAERNIQHAIRLALGREPDLTLWRLSQGAMKLPGGGMARFGLVPGAADLCGILAPAGRWFCLEIKTTAGRQPEAQKQWGAIIQRRGGFYSVARSVSEARAALDRARSGATE